MRSARSWVASCLAAFLAAVAGCAPTLDWREFDVEGAGLHVSFPCRPDRSVRDVPTGDARSGALTVTLLSCEAGGQTFAVGFASLADPGRAADVIRAWRQAVIGRLGVGRQVRAPVPVAIPGSTPNPESGAVAFEGGLPDGRIVYARFVWFARDGRVFQAGSIGPPVTRDAAEPFFAALGMPD